MRVLWGEIAPVDKVPDFGKTFCERLARKTNPEAYAASLYAWSLLAKLLFGRDLPEVAFTETGKPFFLHSELHLSISHSGRIAAAVVSDVPCGVDVEMVRPEVKEKLYARSMHPAEIEAGCDFFEVWTRKECIGKMLGSGMPGHPNTVNSLEYENWYTERIRDSAGNAYVLSAIEKAPEE